MKIINISPHLQVRGGSDTYFLRQTQLLRERGVEVVQFCTSNEGDPKPDGVCYQIDPVDLEKPRFKDAFKFFYSFVAKRTAKRILETESPELVHLHIYYGNFTSSILSVFKRKGIPIVQTVHDYKPVCPVHTLNCRGRVCERCKGGRFWHALLNRCNRGSVLRSLVSAIESYVSKALGNIRDINTFIAVSEFQAGRLGALGVPTEKIRVLHNFIDTRPYSSAVIKSKSKAVLYFGRIEPSKGVMGIAKAAARMPGVQFYIAGTGTAARDLEEFTQTKGLTNLHILGFITGKELHGLIARASATILTPIVYENCPMSILESFALGTPVIGSNIGGIPELIDDGEDGFVIPPGSLEALVAAIKKLVEEPGLSARMGATGRDKVIKKFSPESHYRGLMRIYSEANAV